MSGKGNFCCTFGQGSNLRDNFVKHIGVTEQQARASMNLYHKATWAFCYPETTFQEQIEKYGLIEVPLRTRSYRLDTK
ncbi:hypothetical protein Tiera_047 [Polaromonas phage Tiera]|nr:hypothetical protein Tiera_047 [Polaromonas phage Tiera]